MMTNAVSTRICRNMHKSCSNQIHHHGSFSPFVCVCHDGVHLTTWIPHEPLGSALLTAPPSPCPCASLYLPLQTEESCRLAWSRGTASSTSPKSPAATPATTPASPPTASRGRSEPWWPSLWPVSCSLIILEAGTCERKGHATILVISPTKCLWSQYIWGCFYEETVIDHSHQVANTAAFIVCLVAFLLASNELHLGCSM